MSRQATVPAVVAAYFGLPTRPHPADHPVIVQAFRDGTGWRTYPMRKRVSPSWGRKMRSEGVTAVAVRSGGRVADFQISEVVR